MADSFIAGAAASVTCGFGRSSISVQTREAQGSVAVAAWIYYIYMLSRCQTNYGSEWPFRGHIKSVCADSLSAKNLLVNKLI